ncbi:MAG: alpha/beta hydrolase-fold protein, partial [Coleofasciculaceae cyanobacterium]
IIPVLEELYESGKLPPSIIVTPDGNDSRGSSPLFDPQYFDGPNGKVGTLIGSELPQVIKSRYRALDSSQFWAIGGLSSGGWGAYNIGLQHLENFDVLFSQMGYFTDQSGPANSPEEIVKTLTPEQRKRLRMYFDTGKDDLEGPEFLESSKKFHEILNQLGIENQFNIFPGGHGVTGPDFGWNYNNKHSRDSLAYVGKQFEAGLAQQKKP